MNNTGILTTAFTTTPKSVNRSRIAGFDLARAIAMLGMIFVNYKYLMEADDDGVPWLIWLSNWLDGRPAVTFIILAGIGTSLLRTKRGEANVFNPFDRP